jgi:glycerophosphoryl diester phosphodiesterase
MSRPESGFGRPQLVRVMALIIVLAGALVAWNASRAASTDSAESQASPLDPEAYPDWTVVNVGHRGLSPGFPENTLAAFQNSIDIGVDMIELDLRGTADGEVVVIHDETVDRTTDGAGVVTEMTLEEIKSLDAGSWFDPSFAGERVPTYEEVLDLVAGTGVKLLLDIKLSPVLDKERIVRLTEQFGAELDVIVGVRSVEDLREFRALNPNFRTLGFIPEPRAIDKFHRAGVDIIRLWPDNEDDDHDWIYDSRDSRRCQAEVRRRQRQYERGRIDDPGSRSCLVQKVHDLGLPVWTTADDRPREELDELIQLRVNGILTDLPLVLAELLADIEAARDQP